MRHPTIKLLNTQIKTEIRLLITGVLTTNMDQSVASD